MSPIAGPFFAAALVLGTAGTLKLLRPDPTRLALRAAGLPGSALVARGIGVVELVLTVAVLGWGGRLPAALLAVAYASFAGFSAVVRRRSGGRASADASARPPPRSPRSTSPPTSCWPRWR